MRVVRGDVAAELVRYVSPLVSHKFVLTHGQEWALAGVVCQPRRDCHAGRLVWLGGPGPPLPPGQSCHLDMHVRMRSRRDHQLVLRFTSEDPELAGNRCVPPDPTVLRPPLCFSISFSIYFYQFCLIR